MPLSRLVTSEKGKRAFRFFEGYAVAFALALGGAVAGYAYSEYRLRVIVINLAIEHQAEVQRLQDTNVRILSALAVQVQNAAQKVDQAGAKVANAADQSASAAESAKSAVAVIRRTRPRVIVAPEPVPEPVRANLNSAIERTNRKLLEQRK
jgi:hypothetical protein